MEGGGPAGRSATELLQRFKESFRPTPPVNFVLGMPAPTAMSWMRRRGPQVPHAVLHRLFRQRQIRLFDGERVTRVRACRPLRNGEVLLFPADLQPPSGSRSPAQGLRDEWTGEELPAATSSRRRVSGEANGEEAEEYGSKGRVASHAAAGPGPGSSAVGSMSGRQPLFADAGRDACGGGESDADDDVGAGTDTAAGPAAAGVSRAPPPLVLTPERVRRWVLGIHPGLLFVNKPAGVRVHGRAAGDDDGPGGRRGGGGGAAAVARSQTLEGVMQSALRFAEDDEPRLVHRLDEQASGVMVLARNADSAAWLSAAFRNKAAQALAEAEREDQEEGDDDRAEDAAGDVSRGLFVRRTYWAFLAGELQPRQSGRIRYPVLVDGAYQPAVTSYRVRATGSGVSWVELTPETGRRHQLRVHCAHRLGAPIIGDARYGYRGLQQPSSSSSQAATPSSSSSSSSKTASASSSVLPLRDRLPPEWWALLGEDPRVVRRRAERAGAPPPPPAPVLLHARELVVKRPGKSALVGVAPLPRYIRELMEAAGWQVPR